MVDGESVHQPSAMTVSHQPLAISGFIESARGSPRPAASETFQREPSSVHDTIAGDHHFGVTAARRREAAPDAGARRERRDRALISVNARERDRLRVERERSHDRQPHDARDDSRTR